MADADELKVPGAGLMLAATRYGRPGGPPALLLHGGGQTRHAWGTAGSALAERGWNVLSLDLRGHGDSDWSPDADYSLGAFASDVRAVATSLDSRPALIGASLGGLASLVAVGESDGPLATALVLVDVTPTIEREGSEHIRDFMVSGMDGFASLEEAADSIAGFIPNRPRPSDVSGLRKNLRLRDGRWHWHWDPRFVGGREGIDGQRGLVDHDRLVAAAARVTIPTILVRGRLSDVVGEAGVRELQELIPHAEVVEVAGAGHMVAGDRNDAFNDAVVAFVEATGSS